MNKWERLKKSLQYGIEKLRYELEMDKVGILESVLSEMEYMEHEEIEKEINGWKYYRNPSHGKMVAYHRMGSDPEQIVFDTDEAFEKWLEAERNE